MSDPAKAPTVRLFPVLTCGFERRALDAAGCPRVVPWAWIELHSAQVEANHGQTLERLAERGGLSPAEMVVAARGERLGLSHRRGLTDVGAVAPLLEMLEAHEREGDR